ncbi:TPA: 30S ribosomal protein S3 [Patescibacteria group bacterium]|nr:MAG: 30S ribosomal protein S3 [Parcubacteria group bacterium GW2011_GWA2_46_39]HBV33393.1 30S ribosomal protein S3 [Patescibacteria group bacterium]HCU47819.1 30S ribosomal protein S3 [Patescibacteria group bacterium]
MGQKVHPISFRTGVVYTWKSKWFSARNYTALLASDIKIRKWLKSKLRGSAVDKVEIERSPTAVNVIIHTAKPGLIIGRGGAQVEELKKEIKKRFLKPNENLQLNIQEVGKGGLSANVVAESMALEIEKRMPFRRVMKQAMDQVMKAGGLGVKVQVAGRLNGAEIARTETLALGKVPLQTLRAEVDYARTAARTTYGNIGIKVWINKGEVFNSKADGGTPAVA